jgi:hypothetical protein
MTLWRPAGYQLMDRHLACAMARSDNHLNPLANEAPRHGAGVAVDIDLDLDRAVVANTPLQRAAGPKWLQNGNSKSNCRKKKKWTAHRKDNSDDFADGRSIAALAICCFGSVNIMACRRT